MKQITPAEPTVMPNTGDHVFDDLEALPRRSSGSADGTALDLVTQDPTLRFTSSCYGYPDESMEPNDTLDQATVYSGDLSGPGFFSRLACIGDTPNGTNDVDLMLFELEAGKRIFIETNAGEAPGLQGPLEAILRVFDSSGTELAVDYQPIIGPFGGSFISFEAPVDDTYAVGVSGFANFDYDPTVEGSGTGGSAIGPYRLNVWFGDLSEPSDTLDQADDFTDQLRKTGSLELTGFIGDQENATYDVDFALFDLKAGEFLLLEADVFMVGKFGPRFDATIRVFDLSGAELPVNQYYYDDFSSELGFIAPVDGVYGVSVTSLYLFDYDPTVAGSGFGEGGGTGLYNLNVTAVEMDLEVRLYDADSDELIAVVGEDDTIRLDMAGDRNLTIAATGPEDSLLFKFVESMRLDLNDGAVTRTESFGAYTLFGDSNGDFQGGDIPVGENVIAFDLYSENGLRGDLLGSLSRSFTLIDLGTALEIGLYDADTDELIAPIRQGDEIQVDGAAERNLTIAAIVPEDSPVFGEVDSMRLDLNNGAVIQAESFGAFSLFGDPGGDLRGGDVPLGENVVTFDLYSENQLRGDFLGSVTRSFTIVDTGSAPDAVGGPFDANAGTGSIGVPFVDDLV